MKKGLLILVAIICFVFASQAQDIILKHDGSDIKAKVLEITELQVKYKDFDFQDGPTRNINISDVFMITYENGQKEIFQKQTPAPAPVQATPAQTVSKEPTAIIDKRKPCAPKNAFGLDIGTGVLFDVDDPSFGGAIGFRYLHHFSPYFGVDFIKINTQIDFIYEDVYVQLMTGVRGNTKVFNGKCLSGYGALRVGLGSWEFEDWNFCSEFEIGFNLTRTLFIGYSCNFHINDGDLLHFHAVRLGFNFHGKKQNYRFETK